MPAASGSGPMAPRPRGSGAAADHAFTNPMRTTQEQMSGTKTTGKPDQGFVSMMIANHQGAIAMAETELKYGKSPCLKRVARMIIASQSREVKEMRHWRAQHPKMQ